MDRLSRMASEHVSPTRFMRSSASAASKKRKRPHSWHSSTQTLCVAGTSNVDGTYIICQRRDATTSSGNDLSEFQIARFGTADLRRQTARRSISRSAIQKRVDQMGF